MSEHSFTTRHGPGIVLVLCSCGASRQFTRRQNALARAAKVRAWKREHLLATQLAQAVPRPAFVTDAQLELLDSMRGAGTIGATMLGAAPWLVKHCGLTLEQAHEAFEYWTDTYAVRHPEKR